MRLLSAVIVLLFAAAPLSAQSATEQPSAAPPPKAVLILSEGPGLPLSGGPVLPYGTVLRARIVEALRTSPEPLNVYEELIDRIRFDSDEYDRQLVALYQAKYSNPAPDLIITLTEPALDFALRHRAELFPASNLLFGAIDERAIGGRKLGANVTGVFSNYDVRATTEAALKVHPRTRQIVVVSGTSRLDHGYLKVAMADLGDLPASVNVSYLSDRLLNDVLARVAALPNDALVVFLSMQTDANGVARTGPDVLAALRRAAPVPIYGMSANFLGIGITGGMLFEGATHGADLAGRALQLLAGTPASELQPMRSRNTLSFDGRELARFGIDEASVPPGATVINRQVSLWAGNRQTILITGVVLVGQSILIAGLLFQGRRRRRAEQSLRDRQEELHRSQSRYTLATAAGSVGVWDWNFETNELFVDSGLKGILGFSADEISNRPDDWGSRVYPQDLPAAAAGIQACVDGSSDTYEVEHRMLHKDGSVKWMLSRGSALRSANGTLLRLVGTKVDITQRKVAEMVIREGQAILDASHREIQDLAGRLITSQELERARLARDLHDDLSQEIAGLSIALSGLKRRLAGQQDLIEVSGAVSSIQERTMGLAESIRRLSHDLHPTVLQHAGLVAALKAHCADLHVQQAINVRFVADGDFESVSADTALCLYRVAQESLRNVVTHANAARADVFLERIGSDAELSISDDGGGFDIGGTRRRGDGLGLVSIAERVRLVGGTVSIVTELGKGTRVRVQVPANGLALAAPSS